MRFAIVALLLLAGCHGAEVRFGSGHNFNDRSGFGRSKYGYRNTFYKESSYYEDGDSTGVWLELALQLSPKSVSIVSPHEFTLAPPLVSAPIIPPAEPVHFPTIDDAGLGVQMEEVERHIEDLESRIKQLEEKSEKAFYLNDMLIGGGGGTGGIATLVYLTMWYRRRRNGAAVTEAEAP